MGVKRISKSGIVLKFLKENPTAIIKYKYDVKTDRDLVAVYIDKKKIFRIKFDCFNTVLEALIVTKRESASTIYLKLDPEFKDLKLVNGFKDYDIGPTGRLEGDAERIVCEKEDKQFIEHFVKELVCI